jgi:glucokinase
MDTYLCLDLGGTKLLIGEIDSFGNILRYKKYDSGFFNQQAALETIKSSIDDYFKTVGKSSDTPKAIGIGLIGRVDTASGVWLQIDPNRTQPIALAKELSSIYGIPCFIDNDVKSATRAERVWGFGQISKNFIYINIGTGIAAGIVVNGRQIRGSHCNAGEIGHIKVGLHLGIKCTCGREDCVEAIASGAGMDQCARILKEKYKTSLEIKPDVRVQSTDIFNLSKKGDPLCEVLVNNAAEAVADLIMNLVRTTDPDTVVLGGGVVADGFLLTKIQEKLNATTMRFVKNGVVVTKLNPEFIGLIGAGAVAMDR